MSEFEGNEFKNNGIVSDKVSQLISLYVDNEAGDRCSMVAQSKIRENHITESTIISVSSCAAGKYGDCHDVQKGFVSCTVPPRCRDWYVPLASPVVAQPRRTSSHLATPRCFRITQTHLTDPLYVSRPNVEARSANSLDQGRRATGVPAAGV